MTSSGLQPSAPPRERSGPDRWPVLLLRPIQRALAPTAQVAWTPRASRAGRAQLAMSQGSPIGRNSPVAGADTVGLRHCWQRQTLLRHRGTQSRCTDSHRRRRRHGRGLHHGRCPRPRPSHPGQPALGRTAPHRPQGSYRERHPAVRTAAAHGLTRPADSDGRRPDPALTSSTIAQIIASGPTTVTRRRTSPKGIALLVEALTDGLDTAIGNDCRCWPPGGHAALSPSGCACAGAEENVVVAIAGQETVPRAGSLAPVRAGPFTTNQASRADEPAPPQTSVGPLTLAHVLPRHPPARSPAGGRRRTGVHQAICCQAAVDQPLHGRRWARTRQPSNSRTRHACLAPGSKMAISETRRSTLRSMLETT
jgi:hypothetical protein